MPKTKSSRKKPIRVALVGAGSMARHHVRVMLAEFPETEIEVICEPSSVAYDAIAEIFELAGRPLPPNQPDLDRVLVEYAGRLDAAFILSPHAYHHDQAVACLEAGLDVLLEKPMVMNAAEARSLIETRDRKGRLLVVAFQGGLSPHVRTAVEMIRSGKLGQVLNISAVIWQNWADITAGTWRQQPAISGGGFLFDTGAHMLNTVADLAGEEFTEVAAWLDNRERPVDILAAIIGRLESGALVTMNGCGNTVPSCASDIRVFCTEAILRTGAWGAFLEIQRPGSPELTPVPVPASLGVWDQFLQVRSGRMANPSPPEVGLRMARLWDAIRASAAQNGVPVRC
ncbi:MAG: Gfo/Idh/MocA family oxidoreductase [Chloroflexi bacterium]|nr:Gfo/Idh/MocA family oxidoreductase [Chloroflexota bacterium]MCI0649690.1 Gfo/Idh/MocA family oxidoreductase [Chloroflexota bacterium]MCI0729947.1 Gfo/Idh/MocA family oxidoreductase [Chloroflexota bacterium]